VSSSTSGTVQSADGTRIAYERVGSGPPVVLIEPALHYRSFSSLAGLVPYLSRDFTVYSYDRRGRGESEDTPPYSADREADDIDALIAEAGGPACLYGYSSGALLALRAAARGDGATRLALFEPPLREEGAPTPDPLTRELGELLAAGRDGDAVEHFHRSIGVPAEFLAGMRATPEWSRMESVATTLVYDCMISDATSDELLRSVRVPVLVLDSEGSTDNLTSWATEVAARLPGASHISLAGEWHSVPDDLVAPVLLEFFRGDAPVQARAADS
jgi:pimeloyl-ACP methyl ester carboxylesterase